MDLLIIIGFSCITLGTIASFTGTYISDKESQDNLMSMISKKNKTIENINDSNAMLIKQNSELLNSSKEVSSTNNKLIFQNKEMLIKVNKYQQDIKDKNLKIIELESKVSKVERGVESFTSFDGVIRTRQGGNTNTTIWDEYALYQKIENLSKEKKFKELIKICEDSKLKYPNWFTLYYYRAIGILNTDIENKKNEALDLLDYVSNNTKGDLEYAIQLVFLLSELNENERIKKVMDHISLNMINNIIVSEIKEKLLKYK